MRPEPKYKVGDKIMYYINSDVIIGDICNITHVPSGYSYLIKYNNCDNKIKFEAIKLNNIIQKINE